MADKAQSKELTHYLDANPPTPDFTTLAKLSPAALSKLAKEGRLAPPPLCEHSPESFGALVEEIMAQGYDEETAAHYAALIGDMPIMDDNRNVIVMDGEKEIARLKPLKMFTRE